MTQAPPIRRQRGHYFEQFELGQIYEHHWGRTINAGDNSLFTALTIHFNPLYFNAEYARDCGHPDVVVNPYLVFDTVFGLSVQDLSEIGGAFLGVDKLSFLRPVYPGDTLVARSEVIDIRTTQSRPQFGIVGWRTAGFRNRGTAKVIEFERRNLVRKANPA